MNKDKQQVEAVTVDQGESPLPEGQSTKPKRNWVEWGKTAQQPTEEFMPGRIGNNPKD